MRRRLFLSAAFALALSTLAGAVEYQETAGWAKPEGGRTTIGNMHGDIAISSKGEVYVSVMDPRAAVQVYAADGQWQRNVPNAPPDFHGFVIRGEGADECIYGARLTTGEILKLSLNGEVKLKIDPSAIPDEFKAKDKEGKPTVKLTAMDVAPNGDLFVTDGYSSDYVHRFDKTGKYLKSFGGKAAPYSFKTLHKIAIDERFTPARIIGCDRANNRMVHLSLDGEMLGVIVEGLQLPAAVQVKGDQAYITELKGRVTVLDKAGQIVKQFGAGDVPAESGTNRVEPDKWKNGVINAGHGIAVDRDGNIFVAAWNLFGRIHRFQKQ